MLLTEFNEKVYKRGIYQEGYEDGEQAGFQKGEAAGFQKGEAAGFQKGEDHNMRELVRAKLAKGKNTEAIAEELETDVLHIEKILQMIHAEK